MIAVESKRRLEKLKLTNSLTYAVKLRHELEHDTCMSAIKM